MHEPNDDESDDRPPFRWNRQAILMLLFTLVALTIPLAGVLLSARGYFSPRVEPARVAEENPALRAALEKASSDALAVAPIADARPEIEIAVPAPERARKEAILKETVSKLKGSVVDLETDTRFLVSVPPGGFATVRGALGAEARPADPAADRANIFEVRFR